MKRHEEKPWYQSATINSALMQIFISIQLLFQKLTIEQRAAVLTNIVMGILIIYGRYKASRRIKPIRRKRHKK